MDIIHSENKRKITKLNPDIFTGGVCLRLNIEIIYYLVAEFPVAAPRLIQDYV